MTAERILRSAPQLIESPKIIDSRPQSPTRSPSVEIFNRTKIAIGGIIERTGYGLLEMQGNPGLIIKNALQMLKNHDGGKRNRADLLKKPKRGTAAPFVLAGAVLAAFLLSACAAPTPKVIENINPTAISVVTSPTIQTDCNVISDDSRYDGLLFMGPHLGNNIRYQTYANIRRTYNCLNVNDSGVRTKYIPTTIIYDQNVLNDPHRASGSDNIESNLATMKKYGLFPIIRVATSTNGPGTNWEAFDEKDAAAEGAYLAKNLKRMTDFPERIIIVIGNEQNLHHESRGGANPRSFARFFYKFIKSLYKVSELDIRTFRIAFPAPSRGADGNNGISPEIFLQEFFDEYEKLLLTDPPDHSYDIENMKPDYVAYNLYGNDLPTLRDRFLIQRRSLKPYDKFIKKPDTGILTELGPTNSNGAAYDNCDTHSPELTAAFTHVVEEVLRNPGAIDPGLKMATSACFNSAVFPLIVNYNHGSSQIIDP